VVCVLAIIGIIAAIILPAIPRGTSYARLEAYALETATLLKQDRNAAIRRRTRVATEVSAISRTVRSAVTGRVVRLPDDVAVEALLAAHHAEVLRVEAGTQSLEDIFFSTITPEGRP